MLARPSSLLLLGRLYFYCVYVHNNYYDIIDV